MRKSEDREVCLIPWNQVMIDRGCCWSCCEAPKKYISPYPHWTGPYVQGTLESMDLPQVKSLRTEMLRVGCDGACGPIMCFHRRKKMSPRERLESIRNGHLTVNDLKVLDDIDAGIVQFRHRPRVATIMFGAKCQVSCRFCFDRLEHKKSGDVPASTVINAVMACHGVESTYLVGGEPFLDLDKLMKVGSAIKSIGSSLHVLTNGVDMTLEAYDRMVEVGLDEVQVTVNEVNPETWRKIRGTDPSMMKKRDVNLTNVCSRKDHLVRLVNVVVCKQNLEEIPEIVKWAAVRSVPEIQLIPVCTADVLRLDREERIFDVGYSRSIHSSWTERIALEVERISVSCGVRISSIEKVTSAFEACGGK